jgi:integral membrane sensor domain MASE1
LVTTQRRRVGLVAALSGAAVASVVLVVLTWLFPGLSGHVLGVTWGMLIVVPLTLALMLWFEGRLRARRSRDGGSDGDD